MAVPLTINNFHVFQIPCAVKDWQGDIGFSELENELGGGYYSQILYGSENGERAWKLTMPTLEGGSGSPTYTGINGETLSREKYLWDLFCEQKVSGTPFAYQDTRTGGYYLVRFADRVLSYQRMLVKLYSTGIELKQWRLEGQTAYYPAELEGLFAWYNENSWFDGFPQSWQNAADGADASSYLLNDGGGGTFDVEPTGSQNGIATLQFSNTTNNGVLLTDSLPLTTIKEIFIVMQMREAAFSNFAGILTGPDTSFEPPLIGDSGLTTFFDFSVATQEYRLNGILHANNDMQAPMLAFGVVHLRYPTGWPFLEIQVGSDRDLAGRFAEVDIGEIILFTALQPKNVTREIYEYLGTKWDIGLS